MSKLTYVKATVNGELEEIIGFQPGHDYMDLVPTASPVYYHRPKHFLFLQEFIRDANGFGYFAAGPSSSGKTSHIREYCALANIPYIEVECHRHMSIYDLIGSNALVTDSVSGATVTKWIDGPLTKAYRIGAVINFDEFNSLDPGVSIGLNNIIEGKTLYLDATGEVISRNPNLRICATGNDFGRGSNTHKYLGIQEQGQPLMQRFLLNKIDYPSQEEEVAILVAQYPKLEDFIPDMVKVASKVRSSANNQADFEHSIDLDFGPRVLIKWCDWTIRIRQMDPSCQTAMQEALHLAILNYCEPHEAYAIKTACNNHIRANFFTDM